MNGRITRLLAIPALALGLTGCLSKSSPRTPPPPIVPPPRARVPKPADPKFPPAPELAENREPVEDLPTIGNPPKFPGAPRRVTVQRKRPGVAQTQPEPAPQPEAQPAPRLGELLTADQQSQLHHLYRLSVNRAVLILASLQGRTLTAEQAEAAGRVTALLKQAVDALQRDLGTATQLAQRADVLARDLKEMVR